MCVCICVDGQEPARAHTRLSCRQEEGVFQAYLSCLKEVFKENSNDPRILEPLRDELRRRGTAGGKDLLKKVQEQLDELSLGPTAAVARQKRVQDTKYQPGGMKIIETPARRQLTRREAAARRRIADLRLRLLDLTNRNRLLNYKFADRSRRVVRIIDELSDELLLKLSEGKRLTFKSLPEPGDEPTDDRTDEFILALEQAKRSDEEYLAAVSKAGGRR